MRNAVDSVTKTIIAPKQRPTPFQLAGMIFIMSLDAVQADTVSQASCVYIEGRTNMKFYSYYGYNLFRDLHPKELLHYH